MAKFGIALEWGSRGRWFESSHSDQNWEVFFDTSQFFYVLDSKNLKFTVRWTVNRREEPRRHYDLRLAANVLNRDIVL